jgi:23S rRNA pseudouridine1911/1915/1917 synthase
MVIYLILKYIIDKESSGKALKHVLKRNMQLSETLIKKLKYQNRILCNDKPVYVNTSVTEHDVIKVDMSFEENSDGVVPQEIPIDILFEDECLLILNKQSDTIVHPTCMRPDRTLANGVAWHFLKNGSNNKIRPVMRLDKDTSGVIIFAKNPYSQDYLIRQMNNKTFVKEYIGIVHGFVKENQGTIDLPISRKPGSIIERQISPEGDSSITHYKVLEQLHNATLLSFILETGRTHQIRVHCQAIGHSLIGDTLYPQLDISHTTSNMDITHEQPDLINRQALHSIKAIFEHPVTKEILEVTAPLAKDIEKALEILRK